MPAGRHSSFTPEIALEIKERLANGESLASIGRNPDLPACTTIDRWREQYPEFDRECARSIERGIDAQVDEMQDIEAKALAGKVNAKAASVVLSSMQWRASKRFAKRYGDRSQVALTDVDGNAAGFVFGIISPISKQIEAE